MLNAADITRAITVILVMDRYMLVILYTTGIIGAILNIITFLQKQIRANSCSVYFLATSIVDFFIMNVFILMDIITTFYKPLSDQIYLTRFWCKVGNCVLFFLPCLSSSYIVLASVDRFCVSSLNPTLRKWGDIKISRLVVIIVFVMWTLFSLHVPIAYDLIQDITTNVSLCIVQIGSPTTFVIIDGFFFSLYKGAITPLLLCIFGILIYYNTKRSRERVFPQQNRIIAAPSPSVTPAGSIQQRNNSHMLSMLLVQVISTIILNIPFMDMYLFSFFNEIPTDLFQYLLYVIFAFIARWFYYMNYCKTFYINTLTSQLFRKSLHQQFVYLFRRYGRE
jgi:hypothetical protein